MKNSKHFMNYYTVLVSGLINAVGRVLKNVDEVWVSYRLLLRRRCLHWTSAMRWSQPHEEVAAFLDAFYFSHVYVIATSPGGASSAAVRSWRARAGDFPLTDAGAGCLQAALVSCQTTRRHSAQARGTFTRCPHAARRASHFVGR